VLAGLLHSDAPWCDTEPFVKTLRDGLGDPINTHRQEDAYDFLTRLQEQLEQRMKAQPGAKIFSKMFSVGMMQEIECNNHHAKVSARVVTVCLSRREQRQPIGQVALSISP
jgi:uncharacterized UBP type Zn finger protein